MYCSTKKYNVQYFLCLAANIYFSAFIDISFEILVLYDRFIFLAGGLMKKIFSVLFTAVLMLVCGCIFAGAQNVAGDVDSDGFVRAADARIVLRAAVGLEVLDEEMIKVADVDNNGSINSADARLILRAAVGLEVLHIHTYYTETVIKEATCTADGQKRCTCVCSEYKDEIIPATGHKLENLIVLPACTQKGYTRHTCSVCSYTFSDTYIDKLGHTYRSVVTAPTCTKQGYTTKICEACSHKTLGDYVEAKGHSFKSAVTLPTCTKQGYTAKICRNCSAKEIVDYVEAKGHSYKSVVTAPTCTENGYTTYKCSDCTASYTGDYVSKKGHSYEYTEILPTCTQDGEIIYLCLCGDSFRETISAVGHSFEGSNCSVCNALNPDYVQPAEYASIKGRITFEASGNAVSDQGAKLLLIPVNDTVKNYDNTSAVTLVPGNYESGIRVRVCDSTGSYNFSSDVCVGTYLLVIVSENSNSVFRLTDEYGWNSYINDLLGEYFSPSETDCFKTLCSYYRIEAQEIEITADEEKVINVCFEESDF